MGLGVAQDEAQLRPRTPFSRPRTFKEGVKKRTKKKIRKMTTKERKWGLKWDPKIVKKGGSKTDPNIISLSFGSLRL